MSLLTLITVLGFFITLIIFFLQIKSDYKAYPIQNILGFEVGVSLSKIKHKIIQNHTQFTSLQLYSFDKKYIKNKFIEDIKVKFFDTSNDLILQKLEFTFDKKVTEKLLIELITNKLSKINKDKSFSIKFGKDYDSKNCILKKTYKIYKEEDLKQEFILISDKGDIKLIFSDHSVCNQKVVEKNLAKAFK